VVHERDEAASQLATRRGGEPEDYYNMRLAQVKAEAQVLEYVPTTNSVLLNDDVNGCAMMQCLLTMIYYRTDVPQGQQQQNQQQQQQQQQQFQQPMLGGSSSFGPPSQPGPMMMQSVAPQVHMVVSC